ncbi:paralemmin-2-like [Carcharodon carcharias]|uniref:paralemmin-2-like n=1 Tax=Carcharodon carcharias TaxID=13397 RepID=UPI001B7E634C|nr:paralemmin-2-like [Carcharodon carcharias]XP_041063552.1 paralemmin-2-like [Carcharodon carcharias]XP_041063554.1 paralemmin-2-like [Carcharodon carcharias]XP_041063555.1 paralemmin-2-like [Carcharodon carcharias]
MEESRLLKERLQAITDKRKIQEKITRQRFELDEEKLKLKYLKSKSLRERWLLEGVANTYPQEQEAMKKQHQEDQLQSRKLEQNILRLEEEIKALENQEAQISLNEQMLLKKLKAAERSTADIIKAAQAENDEDQFVHSEIPDPSKSYKSQDQQRTASPNAETQDIGQPKEALFAVEINVQKDMKTGESTILSTIPVMVDEIKNKGVKVYEDGVKSVYAVRSDGGRVQNGIDNMTHEEVQALLEQAGEKQTSVSAVCHAPVYSSSHNNRQSPKMLPTGQTGSEPMNQENMTKDERIERHNPVMAQTYGSNDTVVYQERDLPTFPQPTSLPATFSPCPVTNFRSLSSTQLQSQQHNEPPSTEDKLNSVQVRCHQQMDNHREAVFISSELDHDGGSSSASDETVISFNVVHSLPSTINTEEPVTMVFMGYHNVDDENETKKILGYEGAIRAELVMISDDDDSEVSPHQANSHTTPVLHPTPSSTRDEIHKTSYAAINLTTGGSTLPKKSALISGQDTTTNHCPYKNYSDGHMDGIGNYDDASVSALRSKMTRLGKKLVM